MFVSGQIGLDPTTGKLVSEDVAKQVRAPPVLLLRFLPMFSTSRLLFLLIFVAGIPRACARVHERRLASAW
jgi:hypothetical protein